MIKQGEVYYYHLDQFNTPRFVTSQQANVVWENTANTYGYEDSEQHAEREGKSKDFYQPIRFQGQYFDQESGFHYNRFRYYCPKQQRFIHQDPIGIVGGINHYQYAPNPVNWVDPMGLSCKELKKYNSTPLLTDYEGEHDPNNLNRWNHFFGNDVVCQYLDENQRKPFEVTVQDGLLAYKNGPNKGKLVDTREMSSLHSATPSAIFVMDPNGSVYLGSHGQPGSFHHSSFLAGGNVSSAGEMIVHDGKIVEISNSSGHYKPKQSLNDQVFKELESKGMSKSDVGNITRSGVEDSGQPMVPKKQGRIEEANNWQPGDKIPYDWDEF